MLTVFWSVSEIFLFRNYVIHWTEVRPFKALFIYKTYNNFHSTNLRLFMDATDLPL